MDGSTTQSGAVSGRRSDRARGVGAEAEPLNPAGEAIPAIIDRGRGRFEAATSARTATPRIAPSGRGRANRLGHTTRSLSMIYGAAVAPTEARQSDRDECKPLPAPPNPPASVAAPRTATTTPTPPAGPPTAGFFKPRTEWSPVWLDQGNPQTSSTTSAWICGLQMNSTKPFYPWLKAGIYPRE